MLNVALVGSNFGFRGYLPVINKIRKLNLKIICCRNQNRIPRNVLKKIDYENNWKKIFRKNIDIIILAVPPKLQEKILLYNLKFKKKIIFEKPISTNVFSSKKIVSKLKKKKIKSQINLTYLNHELFEKTFQIIKKKKFGHVIDYKILWNFVSIDFNKKLKSWKTDEKLGGGIKNIFLLHVLSYCEFFFGKTIMKDYLVKKSKFAGINFKTFIKLSVISSKNINGNINLHVKKNGNQSHKIEINFERGRVILFTKSKDWTKNFILKTYNKKFKKKYKIKKKNSFKDGRSNQVYLMIKKFLKKPSYRNINFCLNSEIINNKIN